MSTLVDQIDTYGYAVAYGGMTLQEAAQELAEASNGGLTLQGATDVLEKWAATGDAGSLYTACRTCPMCGCPGMN